MTYDEFLITMKERIQERLGRSNKVSTEKVLDNDGVISDNLYFSVAECSIRERSRKSGTKWQVTIELG